jgi:hypothetical protein
MPNMCQQIVRPKATTKTADVVFRPKHEIVHDELFAAFEEVAEFNGTRGVSKDVAFGDLHHGGVAELRVHRVVVAEGGFFLDEEGFSSDEPLGWGNDLNEEGMLVTYGMEGVWKGWNIPCLASCVIADGSRVKCVECDK